MLKGQRCSVSRGRVESLSDCSTPSNLNIQPRIQTENPKTMDCKNFAARSICAGYGYNLAAFRIMIALARWTRKKTSRRDSEKRIQIMKATVKIVFKVLGVLIFLAGGIWFLQGINILPGSYMTGNPQWAINGLIAMLIGVGLFWFANRKK